MSDGLVTVGNKYVEYILTSKVVRGFTEIVFEFIKSLDIINQGYVDISSRTNGLATVIQGINVNDPRFFSLMTELTAKRSSLNKQVNNLSRKTTIMVAKLKAIVEIMTNLDILRKELIVKLAKRYKYDNVHDFIRFNWIDALSEMYRVPEYKRVIYRMCIEFARFKAVWTDMHIYFRDIHRIVGDLSSVLQVMSQLTGKFIKQSNDLMMPKENITFHQLIEQTQSYIIFSIKGLTKVENKLKEVIVPRLFKLESEYRHIYVTDPNMHNQFIKSGSVDEHISNYIKVIRALDKTEKQLINMKDAVEVRDAYSIKPKRLYLDPDINKYAVLGNGYFNIIARRAKTLAEEARTIESCAKLNGHQVIECLKMLPSYREKDTGRLKELRKLMEKNLMVMETRMKVLDSIDAILKQMGEDAEKMGGKEIKKKIDEPRKFVTDIIKNVRTLNDTIKKTGGSEIHDIARKVDKKIKKNEIVGGSNHLLPSEKWTISKPKAAVTVSHNEVKEMKNILSDNIIKNLDVIDKILDEREYDEINNNNINNNNESRREKVRSMAASVMMLYNRILHPGERFGGAGNSVKFSELTIDNEDTVNEIIDNKIMTFQEFLVHIRNEFISKLHDFLNKFSSIAIPDVNRLGNNIHNNVQYFHSVLNNIRNSSHNITKYNELINLLSGMINSTFKDDELMKKEKVLYLIALIVHLIRMDIGINADNYNNDNQLDRELGNIIGMLNDRQYNLLQEINNDMNKIIEYYISLSDKLEHTNGNKLSPFYLFDIEIIDPANNNNKTNIGTILLRTNPVDIIFDNEKYALFLANVIWKLMDYKKSFDKLETINNPADISINNPFDYVLDILKESFNKTNNNFDVKGTELRTYLVRRLNAVSEEIKEMDAGTMAIPYNGRIIRVKIDKYNPFVGITDEKKEKIRKGVEEAANEAYLSIIAYELGKMERNEEVSEEEFEKKFGKLNKPIKEIRTLPSYKIAKNVMHGGYRTYDNVENRELTTGLTELMVLFDKIRDWLWGSPNINNTILSYYIIDEPDSVQELYRKWLNRIRFGSCGGVGLDEIQEYTRVVAGLLLIVLLTPTTRSLPIKLYDVMIKGIYLAYDKAPPSIKEMLESNNFWHNLDFINPDPDPGTKRLTTRQICAAFRIHCILLNYYTMSHLLDSYNELIQMTIELHDSIYNNVYMQFRRDLTECIKEIKAFNHRSSDKNKIMKDYNEVIQLMANTKKRFDSIDAIIQNEKIYNSFVKSMNAEFKRSLAESILSAIAKDYPARTSTFVILVENVYLYITKLGGFDVDNVTSLRFFKEEEFTSLSEIIQDFCKILNNSLKEFNTIDNKNKTNKLDDELENDKKFEKCKNLQNNFFSMMNKKTDFMTIINKELAKEIDKIKNTNEREELLLKKSCDEFINDTKITVTIVKSLLKACIEYIECSSPYFKKINMIKHYKDNHRHRLEIIGTISRLILYASLRILSLVKLG